MGQECLDLSYSDLFSGSLVLEFVLSQQEYSVKFELCLSSQHGKVTLLLSAQLTANFLNYYSCEYESN